MSKYKKFIQSVLILFFVVISSPRFQTKILDSKITVEIENVTISDAISSINKQLDGVFSYNPDILSKSKTITLKEKNIQLRKVLKKILNKTDVIFKEFNGKIILLKVKKTKKVSFSGTVTDASSGELLIGANVFVIGTSIGASSNQYGYYSITLPAKLYDIKCSYIGYKTKILRNISLQSSKKIDIALVPETIGIEEVVVESKVKNFNISSVQMGALEVSPKQIKSVPIILGEQDILKSIQLMSGVSSAGEGQSGFLVRGGTADQNLIILDEAPIYNASHLFGFFSIFNSDAIKNAKLIKGNSSAEYGGRLSSVFDIKMKDGSKKEASVYGGIGLISSRLAVEAPIIKDKVSFILLGRRTYLDLFIPLLPKENIDSDSKIYFYDFNTKLNAIITKNDRLYFSGYFGKDVASFGNLGAVIWGNKTGTIRWNHIFSNKLFSNTTFLYSDFKYNLGLKDGGDNSLISIDSGIKDLSIKTDFEYYLNNENRFKFGFDGISHTFIPGKVAKENTSKKIGTFNIKDINALEGNFYLSHEYKFNSRVKVEYGVRYSTFSIIGPGEYYNFDKKGNVIDTSIYKSGEVAKTYQGIDPRISVNYLLDVSSSLKFAYARNRQNIHLLSNSTTGTPFDRWQPSTPLIKPEISDQFSIGYFKNFNESAYEFSAELYYKDLKNQVDYKNGADLILNKYVEADLVFGTGRAYGLELSLKKNFGKFTGWISYTLSRVEKKFAEINKGKLFPAKQDKTHDISIVGIYNLNENWTFSASWIYSTGNAVTFPSGKYKFGGRTATYFTERNGYRMPAYHRLDLGATWYLGEKSSLVFSLYNAYGRANAYSITFREVKNNPRKTEAVKLSLFKFVPSITYNFKF